MCNILYILILKTVRRRKNRRLNDGGDRAGLPEVLGVTGRVFPDEVTI